MVLRVWLRALRVCVLFCVRKFCAGMCVCCGVYLRYLYVAYPRSLCNDQ